ncbi:hypothetical protein ACFXPS_08170 [Nocardia sp. NPDC059091]
MDFPHRAPDPTRATPPDLKQWRRTPAHLPMAQIYNNAATGSGVHN